MRFIKTLESILNEGSMLTPSDPGSGAGGGKQNFKVNQADKGSTFRKADARRKARERARKKSLEGKTSKSENEEEKPDPRKFMEKEFKFTLKEYFVNKLMEYVASRKSKPMFDALKLMEEYPALKKYAMEKSQKSLPNRGFAVYCTRESALTEEIGKPGYRSGSHPHNWSLSKSSAVENAKNHDHYCILEAKVLPSQVMIYLPAFTKDMEELVFSGKIEEPEKNVIRLTKQQNEAILPESIDTGLIVEICK